MLENINQDIFITILNFLSYNNIYAIKETNKYLYFIIKLFEEYYPNMSHIVPYFWMPKYVDASDASARTLNIYKEVPRRETIEEPLDA